MSPQVFRGRTAFEAQRAAASELGPEAVVLTTRQVPRAGIRGWFGATDVEVAAARAIAAPAPAVSALAVGPSSENPFAPGAYAAAQRAGAPAPMGEVAALRAELKSDIRTLKTMVQKAGDSSDLAAEIAQLRELVQDLAGDKPRRADKAGALLRALGIEGPVATLIARAMKGKADARAALREELGRLLRVAPFPLDGSPAMIAVIGPSGVGKTTTAAKLAARARMEGKTVTLVGCDEFRVGAVEQLARYADLMGADLAVARTSDELRKVLDAVRTNLVIVDTSGRPPTADGVEIALVPPRRESGKAGGRTRHVLLCVPATVRAQDANRIARRYGALAPTSAVITKIDETEAPAGIVHASWASRLPISITCFGQRVPEDIAPATVSGLIDHVAPRGAGNEGGVQA